MVGPGGHWQTALAMAEGGGGGARAQLPPSQTKYLGLLSHTVCPCYFGSAFLMQARLRLCAKSEGNRCFEHPSGMQACPRVNIYPHRVCMCKPHSLLARRCAPPLSMEATFPFFSPTLSSGNSLSHSSHFVESVSVEQGCHPSHLIHHHGMFSSSMECSHTHLQTQQCKQAHSAQPSPAAS